MERVLAAGAKGMRKTSYTLAAQIVPGAVSLEGTRALARKCQQPA